MHGVAGGRHRPADVEQVVPERRDPLADLGGAPLLDMVFDLVDLGVQLVDQVEVALGDLVDEAVEVHADRVVRPACVLGRPRVERLFARRGLRHGDELLRRQDEIDLLVVDAVLFRHRDRDQEHANDVVAVRLDPWARLVVVDERREQELERRRVELVGEVRSQRVCGGVDQVDPARSLGHRARPQRRGRLVPDGLGFGARCGQRGARVTL